MFGLRTRPLRGSVGLTLVVALIACDSPAEPDPDPDVVPEAITVSIVTNPIEMPAPAQVTASVSPSDADQSVSWSSSDEAVATVDANGLVTPLLAGSVTITATSTVDPSVSGSVSLGIECPDPRVVDSGITSDETWENWIPDPLCFDYVVEVDVDMNGPTLTIEPGTVVGFQEDVRMRVRGSAGLVADGTEAEPIVLRGFDGVRGFWEGIEIDSDFPEHVIAHTWIEHTSGEVPGPGPSPAGLKLSSDITIRLEHSFFRASEGYGMFLDENVEVLGEGGNTWTENALGPVYTFASEVDDLLIGESVLTGNDFAPVHVSPNTISHDASWPYGLFQIIDHPGQGFNVLGSLTLGPGVEIRFEEGEELLWVGPTGYLAAVGTEVAPVRLTGVEPVPGYWGGVQFMGSNHTMNRLENVIVEYGGGVLNDTEIANVMVEFDGGVGSRVEISNSVLRASAGYGIFVEVGTNLATFDDNVLTANGEGPIMIDAPNVPQIGSGNDFLGNTPDQIHVRAGTNRNILVAQTWTNLGVPYFIDQFNSTQWVVDQVGFTLTPGVRMRFSPGLRLAFIDGASFSAEGTELNPIELEAHGSDPWGGLSFVGSQGSLDYVNVSNGGGNASMTNVEIDQGASGSVVMFTSEVNMSGADWNIVFGVGSTIAVGCIGPIRIPVGDEVSDHCRPPGG